MQCLRRRKEGVLSAVCHGRAPCGILGLGLGVGSGGRVSRLFSPVQAQKTWAFRRRRQGQALGSQGYQWTPRLGGCLGGTRWRLLEEATCSKPRGSHWELKVEVGGACLSPDGCSTAAATSRVPYLVLTYRWLFPLLHASGLHATLVLAAILMLVLLYMLVQSNGWSRSEGDGKCFFHPPANTRMMASILPTQQGSGA